MQELNNEDILNQIITKNYAEVEVDVIPEKLKATLRTLKVGSQLEVEEAMGKIKDQSQLYILHQYSLLLLARSLVKYKDKTFDPDTHEITYEFLSTIPSPIIDILVKHREDFQRATMKILVPEDLEKHFFPAKSSEEESSSSSEGTISEK